MGGKPVALSIADITLKDQIANAGMKHVLPRAEIDKTIPIDKILH
jgi:hypothetical protein